MTEINELQTLETLIERGQGARTLDDDGKPFMVLPEKHTIQDVEQFCANPARKRGNPQFTRAESFIGYVNDHSVVEESRIYIPTTTVIVAVLNHHGQLPEWGDHRATLTLTQTPEWKLWLGNNNQRKGQREFAQFVEDNADDIVDPAGAELLDLVRTIKTSISQEIIGEVDERNDTKATSFVVTTKAKSGEKQELELPAEFFIFVSPYEGGEKLKIKVRLRLEIMAPRMTLHYDIPKIQQIERQALDAIVAGIASDTELPCWYGTPS